MALLQRIIKNDSIKSDPPEIYNVRVFLVSLVACAGALLFGMDMGIMGGVLTMTPFKEEYGLVDKPATVLANLSSNIVSVIQAGAFAGALFASWLANKIGRRWSLISSSILVFLGVGFQAGASGYIEMLYAGRLLAGIAIGISSTINPLYVSENAPRGIRGLLTGFYQLTLVSGLTLAFWINFGSNRHLTGKKQFIIPLALQALPALILCVGMFLANESPRYLAQKNMPGKAIEVLAKLRGLPATHPYVVNEMAHIELQLEEERALTVGTSTLSMVREAFTRKSYRRRSILCIMLMMWSNLSGTNSLTYYSPTIFASVGLSGSSVGLFATRIYGIVKMISCAIFIVFVTDSLGRRKSLIWTGLVQGVALFYVGFYIRFDPPHANQPVTTPGYVALVMIYIFAAVYQFGWGPVVWTYCSEIPPARLRALMMGMAVASQWLWNFVVAKATPSMFATLGTNGFGTYFVYGNFCFVMVVFAWVFVPETRGLSLEYMDELFEQKNVRARFVPSQSIAVNGSEDMKDREDLKEEQLHIERI